LLERLDVAAVRQVLRDLREAAQRLSRSYNAVITTRAQKRSPFLRTRQPSLSTRPVRARTASCSQGSRRAFLFGIEAREMRAQHLVAHMPR
jgi:hypothetical protein